jgi:putative endopeptidase
MNLAWMTQTTKQKAIEKLSAFHVKIGYPDKWRDYSGLDITDDSFWANIERSNRFDMNYMLAKAGKAVDKNEWLMTPQTVNAYYNPTTNEICFPAGILQEPFFFVDGDDAMNYGAIGVVIGHEMTHGFDDQGRQYDKNGNMENWWTDEDTREFNKRAELLAQYFNRIVVLDTIHANGHLTLGENIADQGGLILAYSALQKALAKNPVNEKIDGLSPEQRFYMAYAGVWANNIREQEVLRRTKEDVHSLGRWRVNGTLPHIAEFGAAFGIEPGDPMLLPEDQRIIIW